MNPPKALNSETPASDTSLSAMRVLFAKEVPSGGLRNSELEEREFAIALFDAAALLRDASPYALDRLKRRLSKRIASGLLDNTKLFVYYNELVREGRARNTTLERLLTVKPTRSQSGIATVTLLTMPYPCPGRCVYCPDEERMPKSYIASEPAAARALLLKFDPYLQTLRRIHMLEANGHPSDKIELIIKGGTWSSYPADYQQWFIKESLRAMNEASGSEQLVPEQKSDSPYSRFVGEEKISWSTDHLLAEQKKNETASHRCIGLTLETRPDFISVQEVKRLRMLGCTRLEIGVQTLNDDVLKITKRGHTAERVARASTLLRNAGFKVDYHLMPGQPGSTPKKDLENFKRVFDDPAFRPDMIKIYPCVVVPNTELDQWTKRGLYKPLPTESLIPLIAHMKAAVPPYVRISRIYRDIPAHEISAGSTATNMRQMVKKYMHSHGMECRCLRCREVSHQALNQNFGTPVYKNRAYEASGGQEHFLSFESKDEKILYAFLRLRLPGSAASLVWEQLPELRDAAYIRELHTYGQLVKIAARDNAASQHKGLGRHLMEKAEQCARNAGYKKVAVISGIGVREYYRKLGYSLEGTYMIKYLP